MILIQRFEVEDECMPKQNTWCNGAESLTIQISFQTFIKTTGEANFYCDFKAVSIQQFFDSIHFRYIPNRFNTAPMSFSKMILTIFDTIFHCFRF